MSNKGELDNMKDAWQSLSHAELKRSISSAEIEKIMRKKSKSELDKLILTFCLEWLINLLVLAVGLMFLYNTLCQNWQLWVCGGFFLALCVLLLRPVIRLFRVVHFRDQSTFVFLEKLTAGYDNVLKVVFTICKVFLPIAFPLGLFIISSRASFVENWGFYLVALLCYVPVYFGLYFGLKWFYHFFYGRRIERMRSYLAELKSVLDEGDDESL